MPNFVIFDTSAGFLQWSGEAASQADAFRAFAADAGVTFEPADDEDAAEMLIGEVSAAQLAAVDVWWAAGAMSGDCPQVSLETVCPHAICAA